MSQSDRPLRRRVALLVLPAAVLLWWQCQPPPSLPALSPQGVARLPGAAAAWLSGRSAPDPLPGFDLVYAALWRDGRELGRAWGAGEAALEAAIRGAGSRLPAGAAPQWLALSLADSTAGRTPIEPAALSNSAHRGVLGLEIDWDDKLIRYPPTLMVARNLSWARAAEQAAGLLQTEPQTLRAQAAFTAFDARQVVVDLEAGTATPLFRGQVPVAQGQVTRESVQRATRAMARWMRNNLHPDGRMTYQYYPSSGRESERNNMIRQWMASLCLSRLAAQDGDDEWVALADRNIRHNLARFYRVENGLGLIEYRGKVKLGAIALAALAMLEHPQAERYREQIRALVATTDAMWRDSGEFQTFYRPLSRNREANLHNFYPGEALLLWASLLQRQDDPDRRQRFMTSFRYYRDWHLAQRKPAFVPWHTQAYYLEWRRSGDPELARWIFDMNDWLLGMQARSRVGYDDTAGRFYDPLPQHRHFGPPHASSTGVYLEGLIDAWQLARDSDDEARAERYRRAIVLGLRSVQQLQFGAAARPPDPGTPDPGGPDPGRPDPGRPDPGRPDPGGPDPGRPDPGSWYLADPQRVAGGLRTTVYNNVIRVDNVQHTLMGSLKILERFDAADYGLNRPL